MVDGYNIINSWPQLRGTVAYSLEDARQQLLDIMHDFQGYKGLKVIVVFDAHLIKGGTEKKQFLGDLQIVYTKEDETADQYIERWTDKAPKGIQIKVATSDFTEQTIILSRGATRISARELYDEVRLFQREINKEYLEKSKPEANTLDSWLSPEIKEILERLRRER